MKAIILAAGYATRLYPLTKDTPKGLLEVGGKTIMDHLMEKLVANPSIDEIHVVSNHRFAGQFQRWADEAAKRYGNIRLTVWDDNTTSNENRLGAIGDMRFVIERAGIDDDLLVAASDNLMDAPLTDFFEDFREHGRDLLLAGRLEDEEERKRFAVLELDGGRIVGLTEKPEHPASDVVAYAVYLYRRDTVKRIAEYLSAGGNPDSPGHFPEWLYKRKETRACIYRGNCVDIGTVESYRNTCAEWVNRKG